MKISIYLILMVFFLYSENGLDKNKGKYNEGNSYFQKKNLEKENNLSDPNVFSPDIQSKKSNLEDEYVYVWLKLFLILAFFIVGGMLLIKFLKPKKKLISQSNDLFQFYGEMPIEINKKIQIVKIINEYYVLSVGVNNINLINKIENKEAIDLLELKGSMKNQKKSNFFYDVIGNYFNHKNNFKNQEMKLVRKKFDALNITKNLKEKLSKMIKI